MLMDSAVAAPFQIFLLFGEMLKKAIFGKT
jgi:hypothetical protein